MSEAKYTTFWNILDNIGIEIPAIQRDYAQGREVGRIPTIRRKFIHTLLSSLEKSTPTRLDFIYGKIYGEKNIEELRKNTHAIKSLLDSIRDYADSIDLVVSTNEIMEKSNNKGEMVFLIPLDGQQRLTALFLIHWFIISILEFKKLDQFEAFEQLKRFRYKTRKSTELFIEMLCDIKVNFNFNKNLQEEIVNHEKFSNTWKDDPTVKSMLVVINEIQQYFQTKEKESIVIDYHLIWHNLSKEEILIFDFLNLQNFSLSDDLYVKMNARGKELSDFENFKAWLIGKIEYDNWLDKELWNKYSLKFDVEWNDLFWDNKNTEDFEIDTPYFNYFKILYLIDLVSNAELIKSAFSEGEEKDIIDSIIKKQADFDFEYIFDVKFRNQLNKYFDVLNYCADKKFTSKKNALKIFDFNKYLFNNNTEVSWTELIKNYVIISYLEVNTSDENNELNFDSYIRVLSNLYNNQTFDNALLYKNALNDIKSINRDLKDNNCSVNEWLSKLDTESFSSVFTKDQIEEEKFKSSLFYESGTKAIDTEWLDLIEAAESHEYFKGKIGFLLSFSNISKNSFRKYFDKISPLFKNEILNNEDYLFQRALLTFGNYFGGEVGVKVSFFKNDNTSYRSRRENWFSFLQDKTQNVLLKKLVDDELYDENDAIGSLNKIIIRFKGSNLEANMIKQQITNIDYYKLYIYCPDLFKFGSSNLIQLAGKKYAYQLNATNTGGYFNDVLLEYIKVNYFSNNEEIKAYRVMGWNNSPFLDVANVKIRLDPTNDIFIIEEGEVIIKNAVYNTPISIINFIKSKII